MPYYYPIDFRPDSSPKAESYIQFATVYRDSVRILLEEFIERAPIHDYSLAPVVTLLIQYIELSLKGIIQYCKGSPYEPIGTHNMSYLYRTAIGRVMKKFGNPGLANKEAERFILTLGNFDNKSQAFRYPETRQGQPIHFAKMDGWLYDRLCTISGLNDISEKVIGDLGGLASFVEIQIDNEQEGFAQYDR